MPYIEEETRIALGGLPYKLAQTPGELNYQISALCNKFILAHGMRYATLNTIVGVLECAKLEFYRRMAAPYEDTKLEENGDVYTS